MWPIFANLKGQQHQHRIFWKKWFVNLFMTCYLSFFFLNYIYYIYNTLLNKLQDHVFIRNIGIIFGKKICALKFEFPKQFYAKHTKFNFEVIWWLKPWCASMRSKVQTLMNVCINVSCINVMYKHVHHGKWRQNLFLTKSEINK